MTPASPQGAHLSRPRASEQIFADLQDRILLGEFARGERLPTERELAAAYGVSVNTVRESVRALSLMGMVEVRHGSGAFVTASTSGLVGQSVGRLLRFERTGLADVVRLSGVLHQYAATRAVDTADETDIDAFDDAVTAISAQGGGRWVQLGAAVESFLQAFVACAHDPLLSALSATLDHIVVAVTTQIAVDEPGDLASQTAGLAGVRAAMITALRRRDASALLAATSEYHARSAAIIAEHPALRHVRLSDPRWSPLLTGLIATTRP
ncbi:hypothetical protein GCM10027445_25180 [Amycolatopsis endophytica]|uniref:GntR family transcriptional repressor for pyruvate dehydrogenase complex n=1 Tax=Amycolatopsis endophytica TaxID=860233 RepID=A0A853BBJ9_9PSEU|nr:GntR family transcriptional regulator [Amycolatopsis endophytica]NYI92390.1 GntR family transcriptional repressor for pyruvate dehydrogenase complex [Amycolatopsis endophytica]